MRLLCLLPTSFLCLVFQSLIYSTDIVGACKYYGSGLRWQPKPDRTIQWGQYMETVHKHASGFSSAGCRKDRDMPLLSTGWISDFSSNTTSSFSPQVLVLQVSLLGSFPYSFVMTYSDFTYFLSHSLSLSLLFLQGTYPAYIICCLLH